MNRTLSEREQGKLAGKIAALQSIEIARLKAHWRDLYGTQAPARFSRDLLLSAVAYRMQEQVLGGLKPSTHPYSSESPPQRMHGDLLDLRRCVRSNPARY